MSYRVQKWNVGLEHRKERETFCGCFRKRTPFLRLRTQLTGCEGEWSAFDPLPKLTQASDKDVRIIVGKERESYEPELNSKDTRPSTLTPQTHFNLQPQKYPRWITI